MNEHLQQQLLAQMAGIDMPPAAPWWSLAPGWWAVIALCLLLLWGLLSLLRKRARRNRYRQIALQALNDSYAQWQLDQATSEYLASSNQLLRRVVQHSSEHINKASQTGAQWLDTLAALSATPLSDDAQYALTIACYQADPQVDVEQLHGELSQWLSSHTRLTNA